MRRAIFAIACVSSLLTAQPIHAAANSGVELIKKRVTPPAVPMHGKVDWQKIEKMEGTKLPSDYKQLWNTYGRGFFTGEGFSFFLQDWTNLHPPVRQSHDNRLQAIAMEGQLTGAWWLEQGKPDHWPLQLQTSAGSPPERFNNMTLSQFIIQSMDGKLRGTILPSYYPKKPITLAFYPDYDEELYHPMHNGLARSWVRAQYMRRMRDAAKFRSSSDFEDYRTELWTIRKMADEHKKWYPELFAQIKHELKPEVFAALMTDYDPSKVVIPGKRRH